MSSSTGFLQTFSDELEALVAQVSQGVVELEAPQGRGSGVLLANDGFILTNAHVVHGLKRPSLRFANGQRSRGEVLGIDDEADLAVVRGDSGETRALELADRLAVGQLVVALGHPFGLERSVSLGVVSAIERRLNNPKGAPLEGLIQTDAAINPGNSGGPLANARGQVVGINTAMLPFAQGIGFAIPASTASWVAALLIHDGQVRRRYLGVGVRREKLTAELQTAIGRSEAIRILEVGKNGPAAHAGLRKGDWLLELDGAPIEKMDDVQRLLATSHATESKLALWREAEGRRERWVLPSERRAA